MKKKRVLVGLGAALASFVLLALLAVNRVTPVSHREAVERFHEEREAIGHRPQEEPAPATRAKGSGTRQSGGEKQAPGADNAAPVSVQGEVAKGSSQAASAPAKEKAPKGGSAPSGGWPVIPAVVRPAEGVYTYRTDGHEGFEGIFDRRFPPTSHRTIVHTGPTTWSDHTIFSEERESWNSFEFRKGERRVQSQRNRVAFSVYEVDETVTFNPPLLSTIYPWQLGRVWRGTFSGETWGSYEARTVHREYVTVGGQRLHAWADRFDVELHGDIEGKASATRWLSPDHGLTLREEYRADAWVGPIHYIAEWSVTLADLQPSY